MPAYRNLSRLRVIKKAQSGKITVQKVGGVSTPSFNGEKYFLTS